MKKFDYSIDNNEISHLKKIGFNHIGDGIFKYSFPGYIWQGYPTILVKFTAFDDSKEILIDVLQENGDFYSPYYHNETNNDVLNIVKHNIQKECRRLKIRKNN